MSNENVLERTNEILNELKNELLEYETIEEINDSIDECEFTLNNNYISCFLSEDEDKLYVILDDDVYYIVDEIEKVLNYVKKKLNELENEIVHF